jgi:hypothetical protein
MRSSYSVFSESRSLDSDLALILRFSLRLEIKSFYSYFYKAFASFYSKLLVIVYFALILLTYRLVNTEMGFFVISSWGLAILASIRFLSYSSLGTSCLLSSCD